MTLCIAAVCQENGNPRIALCTDTKVSSPTAASETEFKLDILAPHYFMSAFSGPIPEARELLALYRANGVPDLSTARADDLQDHFRKPLLIRKHRMIDRLVQRKFGLSYEKFMACSGQISAEHVARFWSDAEYLSIDVDILLAGFALGGEHAEPNTADTFIYKVAFEEVRFEKNFACIGDGAEAAFQTLHRRGQQPILSVAQTLYNIYEAKRYGEIAPSVGGPTAIAVMEPQTVESPPRVRRLSEAGWNFIFSQYEKYGPKEIGQFEAPPELKLFADLMPVEQSDKED